MTKTINMNELESTMLNTAAARKAFEKFDQELAIMEKLYAMREHAGLSQRGLAERLGISPSAINRLEKNPAAASLKTLERYAAACGASLMLQVQYAQAVH